VQQSGAHEPATVQRDDKDPPPRVDVSLVLDDDAMTMVEARTYAPNVIRATSGEDAAKKLKALGQPIGKIYVISHSNREGEVRVISESGIIIWEKLSDFSKKLKGALSAEHAPKEVDFRGCKLGEAPGQMEEFRKNIGADTARATNCWSFAQAVTPLTLGDGTEIKKESDIPKGMEAQFNQLLKQQINGLKASNGKSVKNCLTGLAAGEQADAQFNKIRKIYFQNEGNLSAGWASPENDKNWQDGSICAKDMTATTSPCKIVTTKGGGGSSGGQKKGAMIIFPAERPEPGHAPSPGPSPAEPDVTA
jgi:hypothetical protein